MDLEKFYRDNYHIVFGYLLSLCENRSLAEDLTSETFIRAISKIDTYDGCSKPSTWLCAIGKNLYINEYKRSRRYVPLENVTLAEEGNMEDKWIEKDQAQRILQFARKLDEPKNQVFSMRLGGMSFREIADVLGRSENWARVTFFRAKNEILERLEGKS